MSRYYTVECCFWNPVLTQVTVKANSVEEACKKALDEVDWDTQRTCYDACTDAAVSLIAAGKDTELYLGAPRFFKVPKTYADKLMTEST